MRLSPSLWQLFVRQATSMYLQANECIKYLVKMPGSFCCGRHIRCGHTARMRNAPASFVPAAAAANVIIFTKYRESYPTACISNLAANNFNAIFSVFFKLLFWFACNVQCLGNCSFSTPVDILQAERNTEREREGDNNKTCAYEARSDLCLRRNSRQSVNRFVPICRRCCCCRKTSWKTKFEN